MSNRSNNLSIRLDASRQSAAVVAVCRFRLGTTNTSSMYTSAKYPQKRSCLMTGARKAVNQYDLGPQPKGIAKH